MSWFGSKALVLLLLVFLVMVSTFMTTCGAKRSHHWRARRDPTSSPHIENRHEGHHHHGPSPKPTPSPTPKPSPLPKPTPSPSPSPSPSPCGGKRCTPSPPKAMYNVLDFGARGNGVADDTKAFQAAWASACAVEASTIVIPSEYKFLVGPISFAGPHCQPNIVFQLDGTIIAPTSPKTFGSGLLQWLEFTQLRGITIQGSGIIDGQSNTWMSRISNSQLVRMKMPHTKSTALRFYGSYNVTVIGISIRNSPQCHLKFDTCEAVQVFNITVSSPGDSHNTDGIHLENSINVAIHNSNLGCGDDCISIQTGCSNIFINNINCGPGHGISIGGLGKGNTKACVSNVVVQNVNFINTTNGVRIKTWQGGSGSVQNVTYSNIRVFDVQTPIVIDQFYCDSGGNCKNQSSAVALSGITYNNIRGSYTVQPVHLACSNNISCWDINLTDIELEPHKQQQYHMYGPFCWDAYGELHDPTIPPIDCLQKGNVTRKLVLVDQSLCR